MQDNKNPLTHWLSQLVHLEEIKSESEGDKSSGHQQTGSAKEPEHASLWSLRHYYKKYLRAGGAAIFIIVTGWLLSSIYLTKIDLGQSTLAASMSDTELKAQIQKQAAGYRLTIEKPDHKQVKYQLSDLGLKVNKDKTIRQIRTDQHRLGQRLQWWRPIKSQLVFDKNRAELDSFIIREVNVTVQPPQDAVLTIQNGEINIADAVAGKQYGLIRPRSELTEAAGKMQTSPVKLRTLTVIPALTAKVLEPYKATLEKAINQPISFQLGERLIRPSPDDIAAWLEISPDEKSKKVDINVNSGKVLAYINTAAARDIHPPKAQIEVRQSDGGPNRILVPGLNGVDVTNKEVTASTVAKRLLNGEGLDLPLTISNKNFNTITTDSYEKWIEVDLTNKRMYAYERDNLIKTELVSAGAPATPTVTGQFAIYAKYTQQDMRGSNVDGSRYFQPNVKWINYFYRDYAIHGNYWRPVSYFGNINSSHGCVSLVESEAQWMYDWAPIGTPVIVHT